MLAGPGCTWDPGTPESPVELCGNSSPRPDFALESAQKSAGQAVGARSIFTACFGPTLEINPARATRFSYRFYI